MRDRRKNSVKYNQFFDGENRSDDDSEDSEFDPDVM